MVCATGNDRLVRIAFKKRDYDLMTNAWNRHKTVLTTGPPLADTNPTAAVLIGRPYLSQGNCTLTRPNSSQKISSLSGPTTIAMCGPVTKGLVAGSGNQEGALQLPITGFDTESGCYCSPPLPLRPVFRSVLPPQATNHG